MCTYSDGQSGEGHDLVFGRDGEFDGTITINMDPEQVFANRAAAVAFIKHKHKSHPIEGGFRCYTSWVLHKVLLDTPVASGDTVFSVWLDNDIGGSFHSWLPVCFS